MKTIKDILTENRDSVISSIKYSFKVWKSEDIKAKMIDFLAYAEENGDVSSLEVSKKVKTDLKNMICKMSSIQSRKTQEETNIRLYGVKNPKLADLIAFGHEGESFNHLTKSWTKDIYEAGVNRY